MSREVVLMTLVAGWGRCSGPIAGAAIIVAMQNYLAGFGEWVLIIQGVVFVAAVLLFRRGIVGELLFHMARRRRELSGRGLESGTTGKIKSQKRHYPAGGVETRGFDP